LEERVNDVLNAIMFIGWDLIVRKRGMLIRFYLSGRVGEYEGLTDARGGIDTYSYDAFGI
jgi:hypothetical protein